MLKDKFIDVFGSNPSNNTTMQVIVFDKFDKCLYRIKNVPSDGNFRQIGEALNLQHPLNQYQAIRLANFAEFCTDEYIYKDGKLILTGSNCE